TGSTRRVARSASARGRRARPASNTASSRGTEGPQRRGQPRPIDPSLPARVADVRERRGVVLVAEPGAGKTTRLPRALLDAGFGERGEIVVVQPRRLAARMAARRVAEELGEPVGQRIGYRVRCQPKGSRETRPNVVTAWL